MVDADDGYGDAKNVTYTVRSYQGLGVSALFLEDQQAPKECGHMDNKKVVATEVMVNKIKAAVDARSKDEFFILARTDAINPEGLASALKRGEKYLKAGADGIYIEGPETVAELAAIGREFKGTPLATSILENGGKTPWLPPNQLGEMGFTMILYPVSILFRCTHAIQRAAADLREGKPLDKTQAVDMKAFERILDLEHWQNIEKKFPVNE
jgi:2-methylisocitrate lyase-like PEP mutase family enzyme